ncbi:MAG: zinc-finger domain-containing protein [Alphaproteobacteria bacterium]
MSAKKEESHEKITVPPGTEVVACDGGHGALGHPKTWYHFSGKNITACHYCSRLFVKSS